MLDIHCHILPGVDDGSRDETESLAMLAAAKAAGIDKIICTPHYHDSSFSQDAVNAAFEWFSEAALAEGVKAHLGYEIHWRKVNQEGIETVLDHVIEKTSFALVEFSVNSDIGQLEQRLLWKLRGEGITPIIAHPERYRSIQENHELADELKGAGCLLQMSADAVNAPMFSPRRKAYKYMLKNGLYDYIASDAHCANDYADFMKLLKSTGDLAAGHVDFLSN